MLSDFEGAFGRWGGPVEEAGGEARRRCRGKGVRRTRRRYAERIMKGTGRQGEVGLG